MADPLYESLAVVQAGHVYENPTDDRLPTFAGNNPTLLNIPYLLEQQKDILTEVAES